MLSDGAGNAHAVQDEVDDGESENGNDETDDGVKDGVFGVGDLFVVAARENIAETAVDEHDDGDDADGVKDGVGDAGENAVFADQISRHAVRASGGSAILDGDGHGFSSHESETSADTGDDLDGCFCNFFHLILAVSICSIVALERGLGKFYGGFLVVVVIKYREWRDTQVAEGDGLLNR